MYLLDIDECVTNSPCSSNGECKNTKGSFMCECNSGFVGDGFNCTGNGRTIMNILLSLMSLYNWIINLNFTVNASNLAKESFFFMN